ncbi:MAG: DEAD/DEAH box helicase [Deltaproteobacteria bacterium]|nr:DEAD/DEAH box helicase [Deltaproteobacteria bacterium]
MEAITTTDDPNVRALHDLRVTMVSGLVDEVELHALGFGWSDAPTLGEILAWPRGEKSLAQAVKKKLAQRCREYWNEQIARLSEAHAGDEGFLSRLEEPANLTLRTLYARLRALREDLKATVGPHAEALPNVQFSFDRSVPCFEARLWVSDPLYMSRGSGHAVIDVGDMHDHPLVARCACRRFGDHREGCVHALLLVDALLIWTQDPKRAERDAGVVQTLATKPWQRLIAAIDDGLLASDPETEAPLIGWRIMGDAGAYGLVPITQKTLRKGGLSAGTKVSLERVVGDAALDALENDKAAARALLSGQSVRTSGQALYAALEQLIGHPRVYRDQSTRPIAVKKGTLGFAVDHAGEGYALHPTIDGAAVPRTTLARALEDTERSALGMVIADDRLAVCALVALSPRTRPLLEACAAREYTLPKDALPELMQRLPQLERVIDVQLPDGLRGDEVLADPRLLLRLRAEAQGATVLCLVDPLGDGAVHEPGGGPREVTAMKNGRRVYARRDLAAEKTHADAIIERLPLGEPVAPYKWLLRDDERTLDLLQALKDLGEPVSAEWTQESPRSLAVTDDATAKTLRVRVSEGRDWFELDGEIDLGGDRLKLGTLLEAMRRGHRYVRLDARRWMRVEKALRERLERLSALAHETRHGLEIAAHAAPVLEALEADGADFAADQAWKSVVARMQTAARTDFSPPRTFQAELRPYQQEGFAWMCRLAAWGVGGVLADDMGLGKTIQALALLVDRSALGPALVVAPTSVCFNWLREAERFAPTLTMKRYEGGEAKADPGDVIVTSYTLLAQHTERFNDLRFATLILDEAQAVKNADTARAKAARAIAADCRVALSGTPIENHLGELWSLMRIVSPGLLGSADQFRTRFLWPIEKDHNVARRRMLAEMLRPFILRRTKAEVLQELPPRTDIRVTVSLSDDERRLYEDGRIAAVHALAQTSHDEKRDARFIALAAITRLRLLACHPRLFDKASALKSSKTEALLLLVKELKDNGHRALVFSQFTSHLALVRDALREAGYVSFLLQGDTPVAERERIVDRFQRGEGDLFLISLKAGGFGLNLTGADYVIHLDPWWNPAVEEQAIGRAHRIGQTRPVTVYRLISERTIEDQILKLHDEKRDLVRGVLDDNDVAARLSTDDLRALIQRQELT